MLTDDLDFFLLNSISTAGENLGIYDRDRTSLAETLNCGVPEFTRPEFIAAIYELAHSGDIEVWLDTPGRARRTTIRPSGDEIEAGIAGAIPLWIRLTPQGGERWAQVAGVDWKLWRTDSYGSWITIATADRELTEFLMVQDLREMGARNASVTWRELRPWKATDWHEEPVGYEARRRVSGRQKEIPCRVPVWQGYLRDSKAEPELSPRRTRPAVPEERPFASLTAKQLEYRVRRWGSIRTRLAAAMELGRREDPTPQLMRLMDSPCPATRFAAERALGKRREKEAVPALLQALLTWRDGPAADALASIGDERALSPLLTLLEWADLRLWRVAVERAIAAFGERAIPKLEGLVRRAASGNHHGSQERVVRVMSRIDSERVIPILIEHMDSHWFVVKDRLARSGAEWRARILQVAKEGTMRCSWVASRILASYPGAYQEEGRCMLEQCKAARLRRDVACPVGGEVGDDLATALIPLLQHTDWQKRCDAVDLLAELDARDTARHIAPLADDPHWEVRASVARVLARWGGPEDAVERLRADPDIIVRGCAKWLQ